jgi:hypothetical protein
VLSVASTVAPTTTTSSTIAPTTTPDPPTLAEADVRAAVVSAAAAFDACLRALPNCDVATLTDTRAGTVLAVNSQRITEWNEAGYEVRDRGQSRLVVESVTVDLDAGRATAVVCIADGSKLVQPGAGLGGADVIVDGSFVSGRESWEMRLDPDGRWRLYEAPALGPTEATDICPAG